MAPFTRKRHARSDKRKALCFVWSFCSITNLAHTNGQRCPRIVRWSSSIGKMFMWQKNVSALVGVGFSFWLASDTNTQGYTPMKRTDPYTGPYPRKRHSHRCLGCHDRNAVACYKSHCTKPQLVTSCMWCARTHILT